MESYGNVAGDELLKQIAVMVRTQVRNMDSLARMRDDEFCLLLSHCPLTQAQRVAVQLR